MIVRLSAFASRESKKKTHSSLMISSVKPITGNPHSQLCNPPWVAGTYPGPGAAIAETWRLKSLECGMCIRTACLLSGARWWTSFWQLHCCGCNIGIRRPLEQESQLSSESRVFPCMVSGEHTAAASFFFLLLPHEIMKCPDF